MQSLRRKIRDRSVVVAAILTLLVGGSGQRLCIAGDGTTTLESAATSCTAGQCGSGHEDASESAVSHEDQCTDVLLPDSLAVRPGRDATPVTDQATPLIGWSAGLIDDAPAWRLCHLPISPHLRNCLQQSRSMRATVLLI